MIDLNLFKYILKSLNFYIIYPSLIKILDNIIIKNSIAQQNPSICDSVTRQPLVCYFFIFLVTFYPPDSRSNDCRLAAFSFHFRRYRGFCNPIEFFILFFQVFVNATNCEVKKLKTQCFQNETNESLQVQAFIIIYLDRPPLQFG